MRYQRCSIDDAQSYEMVIVLGLEQDEEEDRNIHFDKQTVNLANTKLVKIACAPEMQCSHYCHNNKEDESVTIWLMVSIDISNGMCKLNSGEKWSIKGVRLFEKNPQLKNNT